MKHLTILLVLLAGACSKGGDEAAPEGATTPASTTTTTTTTVAPGDPAAKAKEIFATRCTPCHGADGKGDGAASASLDPKPRNFHDPDWQTSVQDDYLARIIQYGGAAVNKSAAMPANPDLKDQAVVDALVAYVRGLGKS